MLVYGDPQFKAGTGSLRRHLVELLARRPFGGSAGLDFWRTILIQCGQLEQGIADAAEEGGLSSELAAAERATDLAAETFLSEWLGEPAGDPAPEMVSQLEKLSGAEGLELNIKVPEGYEFYALFPEQYAVAARAWALEHSKAEAPDILAAGIRSIGTSLSAVVAGVLRREGRKVQRITVRPKGHPFQREASLATLTPVDNRKRYGLVVDEGPGMSGSSMAAVAEGMAKSGFAPGKIAFLPAHGNEPGCAASEKVREWWRNVPRYFATVEQLTWGGKTLRECLAARGRNHLGGSGLGATQALTIKDVTGGGWLPLVMSDKQRWPGIAWPFERMKLRYTGPGNRAVLWKFSGLGALVEPPGEEPDTAEPRFLGTIHVETPGLLEQALGFSCMRWIDGQALTRSDLKPEVLQSLTHYLARNARRPLSPPDAESALSRLSEMLFVNSREQFGDCADDHVKSLRIAVRDITGLPACSDGRMAPHEWVRGRHGTLYKTDSTGNLVDHTLVGKQPLLWDLAGVIVEWNLSRDEVVRFRELLHREGLGWGPRALDFYVAAYAAFKMGQAALCASMGSPDAGLLEKLQQGRDYYASRLRAVLYREAEQSLIDSTRGPWSVTDKTFTEAGSTSKRSIKSRGMPR